MLSAWVTLRLAIAEKTLPVSSRSFSGDSPAPGALTLRTRRSVRLSTEIRSGVAPTAGRPHAAAGAALAPQGRQHPHESTQQPAVFVRRFGQDWGARMLAPVNRIVRAGGQAPAQGQHAEPNEPGECAPVVVLTAVGWCGSRRERWETLPSSSNQKGAPKLTPRTSSLSRGGRAVHAGQQRSKARFAGHVTGRVWYSRDRNGLLLQRLCEAVCAQRLASEAPHGAVRWLPPASRASGRRRIAGSALPRVRWCRSCRPAPWPPPPSR